MKKFTKFEIAAMKRTAANVFHYVEKRNRLAVKLAKQQAELEELNSLIEATDAPTKTMTGGYSSEQLFNRVVTDTGKKDQNGNPIKNTTYVLKYPESVIPTDTEASANEEPVVDGDAKAEEVEVEDAFNGTLSEEAESSDTQGLTD